jgi:hypothetical protein
LMILILIKLGHYSINSSKIATLSIVWYKIVVNFNDSLKNYCVRKMTVLTKLSL